MRRVPPLAPGERTSVVVDADPCARDAVVVVQLDAFRAVDESDERHNRYLTFCPSQASGSAQERR